MLPAFQVDTIPRIQLHNGGEDIQLEYPYEQTGSGPD
jgi:hypothetical protein